MQNIRIVHKPFNKKILNRTYLEPFSVGIQLPWLSNIPPYKGFIIKGQLVQRDEAIELLRFAQEYELIKSETEWQEEKLYGFFSDGDGKTTFRLPLLAGYKIIGYDETVHTLGKPLEPALPNISGWVFDNYGGPNMGIAGYEATSALQYLHSGDLRVGGTGSYGRYGGISLDLSLNNSIYKNECKTVQTADIPTNFVIKYMS